MSYKTVNIALTEAEYQILIDAAKREQVSVSAYIRHLVWSYCDGLRGEHLF